MPWALRYSTCKAARENHARAGKIMPSMLLLKVVPTRCSRRAVMDARADCGGALSFGEPGRLSLWGSRLREAALTPFPTLPVHPCFLQPLPLRARALSPFPREV